MRNDSDLEKVRFNNVSNTSAPMLENIGMVTDAVWTDFTSDGNPDLVIVGEWMSVRLLKNINGSFKDITQTSGLKDDVGWRCSILSGDFDNDGDIDLIAGNLGLNYKYKASKEKPFVIYAKDFDNNGSTEIVLGYYNENDNLFPLRGRECMSKMMPFIKQKFHSYDAFGKATLTDIFGEENLNSSLNYRATNFASCYIENRGNENFAIRPLPNLAQISSVNRILSHDFNSDGILDVIIGGNMYGVEVETVRNDASIGLLLFGDGKGDFNAVLPHISGINFKGDVRDMAFIRIGENKKMGIIVVKNNDNLQIIEIL